MCYNKAYYSKRGHHPRHGYGPMYRKFKGGRGFGHAWSYPPVNVKELDDSYELHVYAAGYTKSDFKVNLKDDTLTIAVDNQDQDIVDSPNWRRQEFKAPGFERHFDLNEKIDREAISATYTDGILVVTLPKLAGFETTSQDISVG